MNAPLAQRQFLPVLALSLATALWGSTFVLSKGLVTEHDPVSIQAIRFIIAGLVMWTLRPRCLQGVSTYTWKRAVALGAIYGAAQVPQYLGLRETTAAMAGVITGTYVAFVPVLSFLLLRRRSGLAANIGVALAVVGLAVVAADGFRFGTGELLVLLAAAIYGGQVVAMGLWSLPGQAWTLTTIQMLTIGVVLGLPATARGWDLPSSAPDWALIGYLSLIASALTVGLQTWSQARLAAVKAAVILAAEPIWAAGLAVVFSEETMTHRLLLGGLILIIANGIILSSREPDQGRPPNRRDRRGGSPFGRRGSSSGRANRGRRERIGGAAAAQRGQSGQ
ncbi:DMT family transporter [Nocardioides sp. SYSU DS0663]|uniref:DMT family transporter n=1 Tax=Nocardioides sp. SYSU DS0663 TaxID=3416445 RepID=UPI003F4BB395